MRRVHNILVATYMLAGIALMSQSTISHLEGTVLNSGGATLTTLHGAAENMALAHEAARAMESALAARNLALGVLLFALGGFMHAYQVVRDERPVHITVKKKKPMLLYWLEMKI